MSARILPRLLAVTLTAAVAAPLWAEDCGPEVAAKASAGASLLREKKYLEAEGTARSALAACETQAEAVRVLGEALVAQKKYDDAIAQLEAVSGKAELAYAHYWLGHAYYNKKQADKMARHFDRFLQLAPTAPEAPSVKQLLAGIR